MDTLTVDVKEAEMQLSKLLALALQGNTVIKSRLCNWCQFAS